MSSGIAQECSQMEGLGTQVLGQHGSLHPRRYCTEWGACLFTSLGQSSASCLEIHLGRMIEWEGKKSLSIQLVQHLHVTAQRCENTPSSPTITVTEQGLDPSFPDPQSSPLSVTVITEAKTICIGNPRPLRSWYILKHCLDGPDQWPLFPLLGSTPSCQIKWMNCWYAHLPKRGTSWRVNKSCLGFPGGPVVKNPLANAGGIGLITGPGTSHMPCTNPTCHNYWARTSTLEPANHNYWIPCT